jgi:hypothetical protein
MEGMSEADEVFRLELECACGWRGQILRYATHLSRLHCNVAGCRSRAEALVSFGYRSPAFIRMGSSMGVCGQHRAHLRSGRMHMIVESLHMEPTRSL